MVARMAMNEEKRNRLLQQRERERLELNGQNEDATKEKLSKIKAMNDGVTNSKANKTLESMQYKEEMARQEMEKVKEAQNKRQCIKAIR